MATYIVLLDYTEQGLRNVKDSPKRAEAFAKTATGFGVRVKELYWTAGGHDGVLILEAPDDEAVSALVLTLARAGNVKTRTLRAFQRSEMEAILARTQ